MAKKWDEYKEGDKAVVKVTGEYFTKGEVVTKVNVTEKFVGFESETSLFFTNGSNGWFIDPADLKKYKEKKVSKSEKLLESIDLFVTHSSWVDGETHYHVSYGVDGWTVTSGCKVYKPRQDKQLLKLLNQITPHYD
jgi:hypothetical protein